MEQFARYRVCNADVDAAILAEGVSQRRPVSEPRRGHTVFAGKGRGTGGAAPPAARIAAKNGAAAINEGAATSLGNIMYLNSPFVLLLTLVLS